MICKAVQKYWLWLMCLLWWLLIAIIVLFLIMTSYQIICSTIHTKTPLDFLLGNYKVYLKDGYYLEEWSGFEPTLTLSNTKYQSLLRVYHDGGDGLKLIKYGMGIDGIVDHHTVGNYELLLSMRIFTCSDEILAVKFTSLSDYYVLDRKHHRLYSFDSHQKYRQFLSEHDIKYKPLTIPSRYLGKMIDEKSARQECADTPKDWHW